MCFYRKHCVPVRVKTPYLRSRKYPGGARFSCTDSFRTPKSAGKFSCKSGTESLFVKQKQGTTISARQYKHVYLEAHFRCKNADRQCI